MNSINSNNKNQRIKEVLHAAALEIAELRDPELHRAMELKRAGGPLSTETLHWIDEHIERHRNSYIKGLYQAALDVEALEGVTEQDYSNVGAADIYQQAPHSGLSADPGLRPSTAPKASTLQEVATTAREFASSGKRWLADQAKAASVVGTIAATEANIAARDFRMRMGDNATDTTSWTRNFARSAVLATRYARNKVADSVVSLGKFFSRKATGFAEGVSDTLQRPATQVAAAVGVVAVAYHAFQNGDVATLTDGTLTTQLQASVGAYADQAHSVASGAYDQASTAVSSGVDQVATGIGNARDTASSGLDQAVGEVQHFVTTVSAKASHTADTIKSAWTAFSDAVTSGTSRAYDILATTWNAGDPTTDAAANTSQAASLAEYASVAKPAVATAGEANTGLDPAVVAKAAMQTKPAVEAAQTATVSGLDPAVVAKAAAQVKPAVETVNGLDTATVTQAALQGKPPVPGSAEAVTQLADASKATFVERMGSALADAAQSATAAILPDVPIQDVAAAAGAMTDGVAVTHGFTETFEREALSKLRTVYHAPGLAEQILQQTQAAAAQLADQCGPNPETCKTALDLVSVSGENAGRIVVDLKNDVQQIKDAAGKVEYMEVGGDAVVWTRDNIQTARESLSNGDNVSWTRNTAWVADVSESSAPGFKA